MTEITINLHDQPCGNCTVCIGRTIGAKHEQERIIKLINEFGPRIIQGASWDKEFLIALIKGEESNNEEFSGTSISNHVAKQRRTIRRYP